MNESLEFNIRNNANAAFAKEMKLETDAAAYAVNRCLNKIATQGLDTLETSKQESRNYMPALVSMITEWVETCRKARRRPNAWIYIEACDPIALAYVVEKEVLRAIPKEHITVTKVSQAIGKTLRETLQYAVFAELDKDEAKKVEQRLRYASSERKALRVVNRALATIDFDRMVWGIEDLVGVGLILLSLFVEASGLVEMKDVMVKRKTEKRLVLSEYGVEWFSNVANREALAKPFHHPMVLPPTAWTNPYDGGYLDKVLHGLTLVRTTRRATNRNLEACEMPTVYAAVNAIQSTPWRINKRVADVFQNIYATKEAVAGLPPHVPKVIPTPPWPEALDFTEAGLWMEFNPKEAKSWKQKAAETHKQNTKNMSKLFGAEMKNNMINAFKNEPAIYYPHTLDYRQRVYPAAGAGAINPQGDDSGKGLLEFACGKPLGDSGGFWLGVHLSNVWGDDKLPMQQRCDLAVERTEELKSYSNAPLENTGWMKADKPFCFLAACFEWSDFMEQGDSFVSHLPVAMDGSCSGLQHYSAILRDVDTAKAVNVIPSGEMPADVYMKVRDVVAAQLETMDEPMAKEWLPRLKRSSVKQPVMTTVYGVTGRGMNDQIQEAIVKAIDKGDIQPFTVSATEAATWLVSYVVAAIADVVRAASVAMKWLSETAGILSINGLPIKWNCPTGFPVHQEHRTATKRRVDYTIRGKRVRLTVQKDSLVLSKPKQSAGLPPNFIHSMDSSHLISTFSRLLDYGVDTFAAIHDSFGVHACDTDLLNQVLREEFVKMYSRDTLAEFRESLAEYVPEEVMQQIPPPPILGSLDLALVNESEFFFA